MNHCHGSPTEFVQADCGDVGLHGAHDFSKRRWDLDGKCLGAPTAFEAECGHAGPHGEHPLQVRPEVAR